MSLRRFFQSIAARHREVQSRTLAALRDALLPKLISGELRVPDALGLVNEAIDETDWHRTVHV
jgi:hypothetical protein